jgi:hypothetical protein
MVHNKARTAVFLGIALCFAGLAPAAAETANWAVPPQNNIDSCFGRGAPGDAGAPLQIQISDRYGPYRGDQVVMVSDMNGMPIATLACNGPADQFRLRPGAYRVVAFVGGSARSPEVVVDVPPSGAAVTLTMQDEPNQSFDSPNLD